MAGVYWVVQFTAAICGSLLARAFFGPAGHLAATMPKPGQSWQAAAFEAIITFGLILMILNLANGPNSMGRSSRSPSAPTSWPGAPWADPTKAPP
jgi:glycerol uptake facilitator-like aquaporin